MTRSDVIDVLSDLRVAYPGFCRDLPREDLERVVQLWQAHFAHEDPRLVRTAVHALIDADTRGFAPGIGAVKEMIRKLSGEDKTALEAWRLVREAASDGLYNARRRFDALPPLVRQLVGSPAQLTRWAMEDEATLDTVTASNFQRAYVAAMADKRVRDVMTPELAAIASRLRASSNAELPEAAR